MLAPYEQLRNEIQRNIAVIERMKIELSRPTSSTTAQIAPAPPPVTAAAVTDDEVELPTTQPSVPLPVASVGPDASQRPSGLGWTLKIAIVVGGFFVLLFVVAAAGSKNRHAANSEKTTTGSAVDPTHTEAKLKPIQEMLDGVNSRMSAGWKKPPADAVARCTPACRHTSAIYKSNSADCMKICSSAENSAPIACMTRTTTKAQADKCPSFAGSPVKFVLGAQPDVIVIASDWGCDLDLLKRLVGDDRDRGLGQAFSPYHVRQFACRDRKTAVNMTYDK